MSGAGYCVCSTRWLDFLNIKSTNSNTSRLEPVSRLDVVNERFANACQPVISDHLESVSEYLNLPFPPICPEA